MRHWIILAVCLASLTGCGRLSQAPCSCFMVAALLAIGVVTLGTWRDVRAESVLHAARNYNEARREFIEFLPQCRDICRDDKLRETLFDANSSSSRARLKSLDIVQRALRHISLLYRDDITRDYDVARKRLMYLRSCCDTCREHNRGQQAFECRAFDDEPRSVFAELRFDGATAGGTRDAQRIR